MADCVGDELILAGSVEVHAFGDGKVVSLGT